LITVGHLVVRSAMLLRHWQHIENRTTIIVCDHKY
ncbi:hypothetical protein D046_3522B, partial [Vibrio parahaemolyticus V-223/04]